MRCTAPASLALHLPGARLTARSPARRCCSATGTTSAKGTGQRGNEGVAAPLPSPSGQPQPAPAPRASSSAPGSEQHRSPAPDPAGTGASTSKAQRRQASDVADSLWASASGRDELSSQQAAARAEQLPLVLQHGDARAVSDSLWAWATLGQPLSGPLAAAAEEAILRRAPKMTPHEVDSTLWAYAHSGWQLRREVAAALEARLLWALQQRSQPEYLADDLCSLCSLLHLRGSPLPLDDGLRTVLKSQLLYVLQQGERDHGTPWATHAVATSLSHWTQLDLPIDDELRAAADAAVVHLAPDMNGKEVMQVSSAHANGCWQLGAEPAAAVAARQRHLEHISSIDF